MIRTSLIFAAVLVSGPVWAGEIKNLSVDGAYIDGSHPEHNMAATCEWSCLRFLCMPQADAGIFAGHWLMTLPSGRKFMLDASSWNWPTGFEEAARHEKDACVPFGPTS